jgi:hypothetical protein
MGPADPIPGEMALERLSKSLDIWGEMVGAVTRLLGSERGLVCTVPQHAARRKQHFLKRGSKSNGTIKSFLAFTASVCPTFRPFAHIEFCGSLIE